MVQKLKIRAGSAVPDRERLAGSLSTLQALRHNTILEAVAICAAELLRASDMTRSIPKVLELIGHATDVDRAHLLTVDPAGPVNEGRIVDHSLWSAAGISTPAMFNDARGRTFAEVGLASWLPRLVRGETISGSARNFEETVRRFFEFGGVKSTLAVPVFVEGRWCGLIGFDDCHSEHQWSPSETSALTTLAELVGAAVTHTRTLEKLADASRIVENSPTILYRLGPRAPYPLIFLSQNFERYGYSADELLASPMRWPRIIVSEDLPAMIANITSIVDGRADYNRMEFRVTKPDGSRVWFEGHGYAVRDSEKHLIAIEGILTDVTERVSAAEKIAVVARTDPVTGLPNRAAFLERLNLAFARARRGASSFAVLYLDLDHFKDVNDTLGHPAGDTLLQAVANRLKSCVRESDLIARFGGDEFAVLQDEMTDVANAEHLATKISEAIAAPFSIDGNQVHTTASIGIAPYCADAQGAEAMMMQADLALYRAKDAGRNQSRFHVAELDRQVHERVMVSQDLRLALKRDEFELYYQPQVELASGSIVGVEALIRWHHPTRGLLMPLTFIPIAESNGTISPIGQWAIEQACRQIGLWREQGIMPPVVAVNVSAVQFRLAGDLDRIVTECLAKYNVAPNQLELELTESVLMETTQRHSKTFERLRRIGMRLAIDDFGTGYSSLDYLRSFHVARLKIERRFIEGVTTNRDAATIVRATISLGTALGIEVLAEGVETADQQAFLISAGCRLAQGNYFGEAMPVGHASALLKGNLQY